MEKSIIVARAELRQVMIENINSSGLPLFVICGLLDEIRRQLLPLAKQQEEEEIRMWNEQLPEEKAGEDETCRNS